MTKAVNKDSVFLGTELKLNIHIDPIGSITMEDYDFEVEVYCSSAFSVKVPKEKAIKVDKDNYIILIDTTELGTGKVKLKITAYIPDEDFSDHLRTEVTYVNTNISILRGV